LDASQQDESRKLKEDAEFSAHKTSRSNDQKVRNMAREELWMQVDATLQRVVRVEETWLDSCFCTDTESFLDALHEELNPSNKMNHARSESMQSFWLTSRTVEAACKKLES
jgi:hypothetical protein